MHAELEEIFDLIVEGRNREAYEMARDYYPNMMSWDARVRLIKARKTPQSGPFPSEAEIDARHDRALYSFEENKVKRRHAIISSARQTR